jgi:hypothetical protein
MEWSLELIEKAEETMKPDAPLVVGDWCGFCPVAGTCPGRAKDALAVAALDFEVIDDDSAAVPLPVPGLLNPEQLAWVLDRADLLVAWVNAVRAKAHNLAENGTKIPNYKLVDKQGCRAWLDASAVIEAFEESLTDDELFERKLKSPAQLEKSLGSKRKDAIKPFVHTPITGQNLVREESPRQAVVPKKLQDFSPLD